MKLSYNWLKEFVQLDVTPQKMAELFTMKVAEVEAIETLGEDVQKVVVGEILEIRPHPKSTKLQLTKVSIGSDTLSIVCGAKNIRVGQKVPTALLGANLPNGVTIAAREIRGVKSEGMLASSEELGLPGGPDGVLILDQSAKVGNDVRTELGLDDAIFDVTVLPDRSYLLSHIGAARDIAAMRRKTLQLETYGHAGANAITDSSQKNNATVSIVNPTVCPRFSMVELSNLRIQPSPFWLRSRLEHLGFRSVNNLVDLTNYVMLELGQPLHAFDLAKLHSRKIVVRQAKKKEKITTLDGVTRELDPETLVIADQSKPLDIAGIMGGKESEIGPLTSGALLTAANFDGRSIRSTSQRLKLRSDASMRFERGVDPNLTAVALARLVELMPKAGLTEARTSQVVDHYPAPLVRQPIKFAPALVKRMTGIEVPIGEQVRLLQDLGMTVDERSFNRDQELFVTPPSFRSDISIPVDLVEEVIRLYGYDRVPKTLPSAKLVPQPFETDRHWARKVKNLLRGASFTEVETYSFVSAEMLTLLNSDPREHIALQNPMSPEQAYLRSSLIPNSLSVIKKNIAQGRGHMRFFELGRTFRLARGKKYPFEPLMLLATEVSSGPRATESGRAPEWTFLAQVLESIVFHFGLEVSSLKRKPFKSNAALHHGRTALLEIEGEDIGYIAEVHPQVLETLGIDRRVAMLDLEFHKLMEMAHPERVFKGVPKFPSILRDVSLVMDKEILAQDVISIVKSAGKPLLHQVEFFDRFEGGTLGKDKKSYAFHLGFRSAEKTLDEKTVADVLKKISAALKAEGIAVR
jgi:phenylalanyl-tRNA synthetase beta chain